MALLSEFPIAGPSGDGSGDMLRQIYDPTGQNRDIFGFAANRSLSNLTAPQTALYNLGAGVRPNLLDNAYFVGGGVDGRFPVNQIGKNFYSDAGKISIDRWRLESGNVVVNSDSVDFTGVAFQIQSDDVCNQLSGETVTLSVLLKNGSLYSKTGTFPAINSGGVLEVTIGSGRVSVVMFLNSNQICRMDSVSGVASVKLELGSNQTLAYQAQDGTWKRMAQPEDVYSTELLKCQRYMFVVSFEHYAPGFLNINVGSAIINLPTQLRIQNPTFVPLNAEIQTGVMWVRDGIVGGISVIGAIATKETAVLSLSFSTSFIGSGVFGEMPFALDANL